MAEDIGMDLSGTTFKAPEPVSVMTINHKGRDVLNIRFVGGILTADYDPADLDEAARIFVETMVEISGSGVWIPATPASGAAAKGLAGYGAGAGAVASVSNRAVAGCGGRGEGNGGVIAHGNK